MLIRILQMLGLSPKPRPPARRTGYAHPSHGNLGRTAPPPQAAHNPPVINAVPRKTSNHDAGTLLHFRDQERLQALTLAHLQKQLRTQESAHAINHAVAMHILDDKRLVQQVLGKTWVRDSLSKARKALKQQGQITYDGSTGSWYIPGTSLKSLTEKEEAYLKKQGFGPGWKRIDSARDAIKWIHGNMTADEFENFCASILAYYGVKNLMITEKHKISGADGGVDGYGDFPIDGQLTKVAFQAKKLDPKSKAGEEKIRDFIGAMLLREVRHGLFIITADYSARARAAADKFFEVSGQQIELIDQNKLIEIMLLKQDQPHGYGLHRTDIGLVYMNEEILRRGARQAP